MNDEHKYRLRDLIYYFLRLGTFGRRTLTDIPTVLLALGTLFALYRFKNIPEPYIILAAALTGIIPRL